MHAQQMVALTIKVRPRAYQRLCEMGKARGYQPGTFAQLLFDAAFAARVGQERDDPVADEELDEQVRLVFACAGQGDTGAIAKATGVPQPRVATILAGFKTVTKRKG